MVDLRSADFTACCSRCYEIQHRLSFLQHALAKCEKIAKLSHESIKFSYLLDRTVPFATESGWNAQLRIISHPIGSIVQIYEALIENNSSKRTIKSNKIKLISSLVAVVQLFKEVTNILQGIKNPTIPKIIPVVQQLANALISFNIENTCINSVLNFHNQVQLMCLLQPLMRMLRWTSQRIARHQLRWKFNIEQNWNFPDRKLLDPSGRTYSQIPQVLLKPSHQKRKAKFQIMQSGEQHWKRVSRKSVTYQLADCLLNWVEFR